MEKFLNTVRVYEGVDSIDNILQISDEMTGSRSSEIILFTYSSQVLDNDIWREFVEAKGRHLTVHIFEASNPEIEQLYEVLKTYENREFSGAIGVGGGSVLDITKTFCCLHGAVINDADELRKIISDKMYGVPGIPWIGVPTTAGTGSEVTCWATIWDSKNNKKYSVEKIENYAYAALIDPKLTVSMPIALSVSSAIDACAHAVESYWANSTNVVSRALALEAIRLIWNNVEQLFDRPEDMRVREAIARGSMLAGLAFSNTHTTGAHSLSYPLTMMYHIPHGVAVGMMLGHIFELNYPRIIEPEVLLKAFGVSTPEQVGQRINSVFTRSGFPVTLKGWCAKKEEISEIVDAAMTKGRADNNPVELTPEIVRAIMEKVYE